MKPVTKHCSGWALVAWTLLAFSAVPGAGLAQPTLTNLWEVELKSYCDSSPAVGPDGTIYLGTQNGKLWAITAEGARKWSFQAGRDIKSSPALGADGTLYFGSRDRKLYALTPEGKKKWEFKTGGWVDSSPALAGDGTICFGSWDKSFYALNPDGTRKWQFQTQGEIVSSPAIGVDGTIYFGSHDKKFYALSADGKKQWEFATGGQILSSPALDREGAIYFSSVDGWFYALNPDGGLRWRLKTGGITQSSPVLGLKGEIYVGVNNTVWKISPEGKLLRKDNPGGWKELYEASPLVLADGSVCHISRSGMLMDVDMQPEPPQLKWMKFTAHPADASPAVGAQGTMYAPFTATDKVFSGLEALEASVPLARTPWPRFRGNARNTGNAKDAPQ